MKSKLIFPFAKEKEITRDQFDHDTTRLSAILQSHYAYQPIAFLADKSPEHITLLHAAFKAGNPFFHLNPQLPLKKQAEQLKALGITTVFVDNEFEENFKNLQAHHPSLINLNLSDKAQTKEFAHPEDHFPAYFIATSGSTGSPKLIMIKRDQLTSALDNIQALVNLQRDDLFTHVSHFSFDVAVADLLLPLKYPCSILFIPAEKSLEALRIVADYKASVWSSAPSLLKFCAEFFSGPVDSIKKVIHCGENFDKQLSQLWLTLSPLAELINLYGPAEATIAISGVRSPNKGQALSIGKIFSGHKWAITPDGELLLNGPQLITRYFHEESILDNQGFYHSGDFVDRDRDGNYFFLGRRDDLIKIGGMRFSVLQIEQECQKILGHQELVILLKDGKIILALKDRNPFIDLKNLQLKLAEELPAKFIPKEMVIMKQWPLTKSGKIDRKEIEKILFSGK